MSILAHKLWEQLNSISHIMDIETAALTLYNDTTISDRKRRAYYEIYQDCIK